MEIVSTIASVCGLLFLTAGMFFFLMQLIGVTRYKFVLNRMHAAGMGDTLALLLCMLGLICLAGIIWTSLKFALVLVFMWFTSPTSSHLISGMETLTDEGLDKHVDIQVDNVKTYVDGHILGESEIFAGVEADRAEVLCAQKQASDAMDAAARIAKEAEEQKAKTKKGDTQA